MHIIPFKRHFEEAEQDKNLKTFFSQDENLSAIFNWCLEGYKQFKQHRLERPEAVKEATEEYRKDSDRFAQFAESWLEEGVDENGVEFEASKMAAYRLYVKWSTEYNYKPENYKNFRTAMDKKYALKLKRPIAGGEKCSMIVGCRLRKEERGKEEGEPNALTVVEDEFCTMS
jgi:putative DNA primase/helicase